MERPMKSEFGMRKPVNCSSRPSPIRTKSLQRSSVRTETGFSSRSCLKGFVYGMRTRDYRWFSPDGTRIVTVSRNTVYVWDSERGRTVAEPMEHSTRVTDVQFSPDGERLLTTSIDNNVRVWSGWNTGPSKPSTSQGETALSF